MIKLKYIGDYLSIKKFDEVILKDFSILTGKNGSGKTHLLQGIETGAISVEGVSTGECVYFDYKTFFINSTIQNPRITPDSSIQSTYIIQNIIQTNQVYKEEIKEIWEKTNGYNIIDEPIFHVIFNSRDASSIIITEIDKKIIDKIPIDFLLSYDPMRIHWESFKKYVIQLSPNAKALLSWNFQYNKDDKDLPKIINDRYSEIYEFTKDFFDKNESYNSIKKNLTLKNYWNFNEQDFDKFNLLLQEVAEKEKQYQILKYKSEWDNFRNQKGENFEYLTDEEFVSRNGISPIESLNSILKLYDVNGYEFHTTKLPFEVGTDINNHQISIHLKNKKNPYCEFKNLSSGEKILITLNFIIYKTSKNKIPPKILLLDEIESSLHPSMLERLLKILKQHFVEEKGVKIILATHSPSTVALSSEDSIFLVNNDTSILIKKINQENAII